MKISNGHAAACFAILSAFAGLCGLALLGLIRSIRSVGIPAAFTTISCSVLLAACALGAWAALGLLRNGRKAGLVATCALGLMVVVAISLSVTAVQARDTCYGLAAIAFFFNDSLIAIHLWQRKHEHAT